MSFDDKLAPAFHIHAVRSFASGPRICLIRCQIWTLRTHGVRLQSDLLQCKEINKITELLANDS